MANTIIRTNNQVPGGTFSVTAGTASSQFPVSNITTDFTTKVARVGVDTNGTVKIVLQMPIDTMIDTVSVVGSNLTGLGYTNLNVRTSLTSDFSGSTAIPVALNSTYNFGYADFTAVLTRFVEFEVLNASSFVEFSNIFIGTKLTFSTTYSRDDFSRSLIRNDEINENAYGNRFVNIRNARYAISGTFPLMERSNFLILEEIFLRHGSYEPIWISLDSSNLIFPDGEFKMSGYFYINNQFSHDLVGGGYFNMTVELLEVV